MAVKNWFRVPVAIIIVLRQGDHVLLAKRANTGFKDGYFALPGGKHDGNEPLVEGVVREAKEELGIDCLTKDVEFRGIIHTQMPEPYTEVMYIIFEIVKYEGTVVNNEPHKCSEIQFFHVDNLPDKMTEVSRRCVINTFAGIQYDEMGWIEPVDAD